MLLESVHFQKVQNHFGISINSCKIFYRAVRSMVQFESKMTNKWKDFLPKDVLLPEKAFLGFNLKRNINCQPQIENIFGLIQ